MSLNRSELKRLAPRANDAWNVGRRPTARLCHRSQEGEARRGEAQRLRVPFVTASNAKSRFHRGDDLC